MDDPGRELIGLFDVDDVTLDAACLDPIVARDLLESFRWPEGPGCPRCGDLKPRRMPPRPEGDNERWRCSGHGHDVKFNWRLGTAFYGLHTGADRILATLRDLRTGAAAFDVIDRLKESEGMSKLRAHHLVVALLELAINGVSLREGESSARARALQEELRSAQIMPLEPISRPTGRLRQLVGVALLFLTAHGVAGDDHSSTEKVRVWYSDSAKITCICPRQPSESRTNWAIRFNAKLGVMRSQFPPD